jgi:hypothetical protein
MSTVIDGSASVTINSGAILGITSGTAVASTSGTSIDFTSIPSWVKRITVNFQNVGTNGTSTIMVQLGDSGGIETSGYSGAVTGIGAGGGVAQSSLSTGFQLCDNLNHAAAATWSGIMTIALLDSSSNIFSASGTFGRGDSAVTGIVGGVKSLSATLDRIRITTIGGTNTFDAGSINILFE